MDSSPAATIFRVTRTHNNSAKRSAGVLAGWRGGVPRRHSLATAKQLIGTSLSTDTRAPARRRRIGRRDASAPPPVLAPSVSEPTLVWLQRTRASHAFPLVAALPRCVSVVNARVW